MYSNNIMCKLAQASLILCMLMPFPILASTDLKSLLKNIQTMEADFKQTIYSEHNKNLREFAGNMMFKKPNLFRWEVKNPDATLLVTDGQKLWNYDIDLEQVTIQPYNNNKEITPLSFILDDGHKLPDNFKITTLANGCYSLTPRVENSNFVNVDVCFTQNLITSINILDHLGQNSKFEFSHVKNNISIADRHFQFKPPAGVDVVGE